MVAKILSRALALLVLSPPAALALGLGDIHLLSALNAPLNAEIEVIGATPDEMAGLKAEIASHEMFERYKLEWPAFAGSISVSAGHDAGGRDIIRLRSFDPITEPFVTLLVEVNWTRGHLVREYTVLLDPPVYTPGAAAAPVAAPQTGRTERAGSILRPSQEPSAAATTPAPEPSSTRETSPPPASASSPAPETAASSSMPATAPTPSPAPEPAAPATPSASASRATAAAIAAGANHKVEQGDSLSRIADQVSGGSANTRRWMIAIYRENPHAFQGNMNRLLAGSLLRIPENSAIATISADEAKAEIRRQYAAWRAAAPAAPVSEPGRLRLVTPSAEAGAPGEGSKSATKGGASAGSDAKHGSEQESRRLIEMRNAELAQMQAKIAAEQAALGRKPAPAATPPAGKAPAIKGSVTKAPAQPPAAAAPPPVASTPPSPMAKAPPTAAPERTAGGPPARIKHPAPAQKPAVPAEPQGSILDTVKEFWWVIAAALGVIVVLIGLGVWRARREAEFDHSLGRLTAASNDDYTSAESSSLPPVGGDPNFLVEESSSHERPHFAPESSPAQAQVASEDTISSETAINLDQGDPLAEADFHMAYGLYDQAADLVRMAITREPGRRDLKLKLLEVFFVWGNKDPFLQIARELAETRGQAAPGEWEKIVIMGKQLAPEDPLFASGVSGAAAGGVDLDLEGGQGRVDFDILGDSMAGAGEPDALDLDIGSALGEPEADADSPARTAAHLALTDTSIGNDSNAVTRQMTATLPPLMPDFDALESPTFEQPAARSKDNPTVREKVDMALRQQRGADQTAELNIDDLGLDLSSLETMNEPGLPGTQGGASTGEDEIAAEGIDLAPPAADGRYGSATVQMTQISEPALDLDLNGAMEDQGIDLDVGTATVQEVPHTSTQKLSAEEMALPDLEQVTMSEVGTKLDLARAYMDMGDPEGARSILEEVLQEGSANQKQEAQRLLASLPG